MAVFLSVIQAPERLFHAEEAEEAEKTTPLPLLPLRETILLPELVFDARLADQFDAVIHYDHTRALHPLERTPQWENAEPPETYPSGI